MAPTSSAPIHPTTISEVQAIVHGKVFETVHLEFKASDALNSPKATEIAKDISSFANSDGGVIIYGVAERNHQADHIDTGVDVSTHNREWLENVIQSNVAPRIDGVVIEEIAIAPSRAVMVVYVPRSDRGPHQANFRYYKRFNFKCEPMEDYEVRDVRNRQTSLPPLVSVRIDVSQGSIFEFCIENVGDVPAFNIQISTDPTLVWPDGEPPAIRNGVKSLQPRQKIAYMYSVTHKAFAASSNVVKEFQVKATYMHSGANKVITDTFLIDLNSLAHSLVPRTEIERQGTKLAEAIGKLATEVKKIGDGLERLTPLAGPSGLALSYTTLQAVRRLLGVDVNFEQLDPQRYSWQGVQEILGVEDQMAIKLHHLFTGYPDGKKLSDIDGMTPQLSEIVQTRFRVDPSFI
jgi:hypothetical protein